ncbi:uncharacterized protein LOC113789132 [Dermatophagoides pteronyssinus]|uniref:uncharacterized protein LOC113789132 n=1 Tax=Dermatophagoides pteronyssinus TaxID=6956 RepID=UPI003F6759CD
MNSINENNINEIYIVESQRGGQHLLTNGYHYRYDRKLSDGITQSFRCTEKFCRGRMFKNGDDLKMKHEHDHGPDLIEMHVQRAMIAMKERARTTNEPVEQIIETHRSTLPTEINERLPKDSQLIRTLDRLRSYSGDRSKNSGDHNGNHGDSGEQQQQQHETIENTQQYITDIVSMPDTVNFICIDTNQQPHQQTYTDLNQQQQQQSLPPIEQHFVCEFSESQDNSNDDNKMTEKKRRKLELQKIIEMNRKAKLDNRSRRFSARMKAKNSTNYNEQQREDLMGNSSSSSIIAETQMKKESRINFSNIITAQQKSLPPTTITATNNNIQPIQQQSIIGNGKEVTDKEAWELVSRLMIYFNQDNYEDSPIESLDECLRYVQKRMRLKRLQQQQTS